MNRITPRYDHYLTDCYIDNIYKRDIKKNHVNYSEFVTHLIFKIPFDKSF